MKKRSKDTSKIIIAFLILLVISLVSDLTKEGVLEDLLIDRGKTGEEDKELQLQLDIEGLQEDYEYFLTVKSTAPTKEEAEAYFDEVIEIIEKDFQTIGLKVPLEKMYLDEAVRAEWSFQPFGLIDSEGKINYEKLEEEETLIQAQVELKSGAYERIYSFPFILKPPALSEEQVILEQIEIYLEEQMALEGISQIQLPTQMQGRDLIWSEKREYLTPQILLLEVVAVVLLWYASRRKRKEEEKKRIQAMERDYPDIVNQLSLLIGAGMTTRQAWSRLAAQYSYKKDAGMIEERVVYEAVIRINRRFAEGESEKTVYRQFSEEIPASCYHKLMRVLLGNLEKGTQGICIRLEEESRLAFEQRIVQAKKRGEEASTKMLAPLMLMMAIVMGMVMLPALIQFQI